MVLIFYRLPDWKRSHDGEQPAVFGWTACVLMIPEQISVLVAPVAVGENPQQLPWGFTLWGDNAPDDRDPQKFPVIDMGTPLDEQGTQHVREFERRLPSALRDGVIKTATGTVLGAALSGPGLESLGGVIDTLRNLEELLEPHPLLRIIVSVAIEVAELHSFVAPTPLIGQFDQEQVSNLLNSPNTPGDPKTAALLHAGLDTTTDAQINEVEAATAKLFSKAPIAALTAGAAHGEWVMKRYDQGVLDRMSQQEAAAQHEAASADTPGAIEATDDPGSATGPAITAL
jgi:hypothetical protein